MSPRILRIALPIVAVVALAGWALWEFVLEVEAPDEVTTQAALEQLSEDLTAEETAETTADTATETDSDVEQVEEESDPTEAVDVGVLGSWTIDDEFGDFAFESASGSFAGFRVDKALFVGGGQTAVGRSGDVSGSVEIADGAVTGGEITVVMTTIQSDQSQREGAILDAVRADEFPTASFVITDGGTLDTDALAAGETVAGAIAGELTIAGVTQAVTVSAEATVVEPGLGLVIGSAELVWADYGVETPTSSAGTVADEGILEFQLIVRLG